MKWMLCFILFCSIGRKENSLKIAEYSCNANSRLGIETKELRLGSKKIGYSIWMNANNTKVNSFAGKGTYSTVNSRFEDWQQGRKVVVCTSAGYADKNYSKGIGLTIDKGVIHNRMVSKDMDALVVTVNKGFEIYDLNQRFRYRAQGATIRLTSSADKSQFLNWASHADAAVFQTHLLAYDNQLKISSAGKRKRAVRKFLVKVTNKKKEQQNVIFYLRYPEYLYDGAKKIFDYLKLEAYQVDAMINLDTGVNDILELNDKFKTCNNKTIKGRTPINQSTNLLIFYK